MLLTQVSNYTIFVPLLIERLYNLYVNNNSLIIGRF